MPTENQSLYQPEGAEKKTWVAPELTRFGEVVEITKGPDGGFLDLLIGVDGGFQPTGPIS